MFNDQQKQALEEVALTIESGFEESGYMAPEIVFISRFLIERNIESARRFEQLGKRTSQLLAELGEETEE